MWLRLFRLAVALYTRNPGRSWLITTAATVVYRMAQKTVGRQEVIDVSSIKPGEMVIIEHLQVTHKEQIKEEKRQVKAEKRRRRRRRRSKSVAD